MGGEKNVQLRAEDERKAEERKVRVWVEALLSRRLLSRGTLTRRLRGLRGHSVYAYKATNGVHRGINRARLAAPAPAERGPTGMVQLFPRCLFRPVLTPATDLAVALRDGTILCALANRIKPDVVPKYNKEPTLSYKMLENIAKFLTAAREFSLPRTFATLDLWGRCGLCCACSLLLTRFLSRLRRIVYSCPSQRACPSAAPIGVMATLSHTHSHTQQYETATQAACWAVCWTWRRWPSRWA